MIFKHVLLLTTLLYNCMSHSCLASTNAQVLQKKLEHKLLKAHTLMNKAQSVLEHQKTLTTLEELDNAVYQNREYHKKLVRTKIQLGITCRRLITKRKVLSSDVRDVLQEQYEIAHARIVPLAEAYVVYSEYTRVLRTQHPDYSVRKQVIKRAPLCEAFFNPIFLSISFN
jgi:hypothetical protein